MQFHHDGFRGSGDPLKLQFEGTEPDFQSSLPGEVDVLIVGAGPAGQLLATQLAQFPDITTRMIETRPGRLEQGQADGLQCRSLEIFEAFGFSEKVLKEAYWVNETTFWSPKEDGTGLRRSGRIRDTEEELSEMPHVILNQARLHDFWLEAMKWSPTRLEPSYSRRLVDLQLPQNKRGRVEAKIELFDRRQQVQQELVRARFVVGCDGARSVVRKSLGLEMKGDYMNQAWGILDALVVTNFPDIRLKTVIHSANHGSILIIPREGGHLVRCYIELDKLRQDERISSKKITAEYIIERARHIFLPYTFDVRHVAYWSVYEVGQRLTDHFDNVPNNESHLRNPHVFITGDACHTHSAKAGQGMNVSMNDSYNLGWKLAAVLRGLADPRILHTYSNERHDIAKTLIDFDREISGMFAAKPQLNAKPEDADAIDPAVFQATFQRQGRFTAGVETRYPPGLLISEDTTHQHLATGFTIGMRFHSAQVVRLADAKPVHLGHTLRADGRWRILVFASKSSVSYISSTPYSSKKTDGFVETCTHLHQTLIPRYTPEGADIDSVLDVRGIFPMARTDVANADITQLPPVFRPTKGPFGLVDYEKVFVDAPSYNFGFGDLYSSRGVDRDRGCILLVRPDQYIAGVWPCDVSGAKALESFLSKFMLVQQ